MIGLNKARIIKKVTPKVASRGCSGPLGRVIGLLKRQNATRAGSEEGRLFSQAITEHKKMSRLNSHIALPPVPPSLLNNRRRRGPRLVKKYFLYFSLNVTTVWICSVLLSVLKPARAKYVMTVFNCKERHEKLATAVQVLQNISDFVFSR